MDLKRNENTTPASAGERGRSAANVGLDAVSVAALPQMAIAALAAGDAVAGYAGADRWLRLGGPQLECLLMRAEAARRLGLGGAMRDDLALASRLAPLDVRVNRLRLDHGDDEERLAAAAAMLTSSRPDALRALTYLASRHGLSCGRIWASGEMLRGWAAWPQGESLRLQWRGARELAVAPSLRHFASIDAIATNIATFEARAIAGASVVSLQIGGVVHSTVELRWEREPEPPQAAVFGAADITVIVAVFADFEATQACLLSVVAEVVATRGARLIVVDDASPDRAIAEFVSNIQSSPRCEVLRNAVNQGFVRSVNRALRRSPGGDVLLLNSDTRLPPGSLTRFRNGAGLDPSIGVINPLSNHGEFVSYPAPFRYNAFRGEDWLAVDSAASRANPATVVDIPSATGFCVYVTRACLAALGELSEAFRDGYLEDADFGLRAGAAGFRNVCLASVYVPHLGSRSFGASKRDRVARNRMTLARRFPDYEQECDAFLIADPLAPARARLERAMARPGGGSRLLLAPERLAGAAQSRAAQLRRLGVSAGCIVYDRAGSPLRRIASALDEGSPQNLGMEFEPGDGRSALVALARACERVELFVDRLGVDVCAIAMAESGARIGFVLAGPAPRADVETAMRLTGEASPQTGREPRFAGVDAMSRAYLARICASDATACAPNGGAKRKREGRGRIAILLPHETSATSRLLLKFSENARRSGVAVVVFGASLVEHKLLADGHFVTGPMATQEYARSLAAYDIEACFLPYRDEAFWAIEQAWEAQRLPSAYFDWSDAAYRAGAGDLGLSAAISDAAAVAAVVGWWRRMGAVEIGQAAFA